MKIQIMSDLHLDGHADGGVSFIRSLDPTDVDVLVIAGDLSETCFWRFTEIVQSLCARYPHIVYVPGNHEYWHSNRPMSQGVLTDVAAMFPKFHILQESTVTIDGQRFIGTTMWWADTITARMGAKKWYDFKRITGFDTWISQSIKDAQKFLDAEVKTTDIVVTHYLPLHRSIDPRFYGRDGENDNCYYLNDQVHIFKRGGPKLWIHGHSHMSQFYWAGDSLVVSNPLGHPGENPTYKDKLVIDVTSDGLQVCEEPCEKQT